MPEAVRQGLSPRQTAGKRTEHVQEHGGRRQKGHLVVQESTAAMKRRVGGIGRYKAW